MTSKVSVEIADTTYSVLTDPSLGSVVLDEMLSPSVGTALVSDAGAAAATVETFDVEEHAPLYYFVTPNLVVML